VARYVYEFFRPWGPPTLYPLGVLAQDENGISYCEITGVDVPDSFKTGFFLLTGRGEFISNQLLPRLGSTDNASRSVFEVLRGRASHRFLYSDVQEARGTAADVACGEAERLADPGALADLRERYAELALAE